MTLVYLCCAALIFILGLYIGPKIYDNLLESKKEANRNKFLTHMERFGTDAEKERAGAIRQRDRAITFKLIEYDQAAKILSCPHIREKLELANIDVGELTNLLKSADEDEVWYDYKHLLTGGKDED